MPDSNNIFVGIPVSREYAKMLPGDVIQERLNAFWLAMKVMLWPVNAGAIWLYLENPGTGPRDRAKAREFIVEKAIESGSKWILWIDNDVLPPANALVRLWGREADMVGGLVMTKGEVPQPLIMRRGEPSCVTDWKPGDVVPCEGSGFGFFLMKTEIFKKLDKPWFAEDRTQISPIETITTTEDLPLMYRAIDAGYKCFVDTAVICPHVDWKTGKKFYWHPTENRPCIEMPDGNCYLWDTANQRLERQVARDKKGEG